MGVIFFAGELGLRMLAIQRSHRRFDPHPLNSLQLHLGISNLHTHFANLLYHVIHTTSAPGLVLHARCLFLVMLGQMSLRNSSCMFL